MTTQGDPIQNFGGASRIALGELAAFLTENPKVQFLDCVFSDLCGMIRGKRIARADVESLFTAGIEIPLSIYFLDARGNAAPDPESASITTATGTAWPVAGTLAKVSWAQHPHGQVLMTMADTSGAPYFAEPRNVLKRVAARLALLSIVPALGTTLEFYLLERQDALNGSPAQPAPPKNSKGGLSGDEHAGVLLAITEAAVGLHLPEIKFVQEEKQTHFKAVLAPDENVLRAADHVVFLRQVIRAVARQSQLDATFMAAPFLPLPGSAMKVQLTLRGQTEPPTDLLRSAVAGLQATMPESVAIMAPNWNAYRRFGHKDGVVCNRRWGVDNASTNIALNATATGGQVIAHKMASADANPYLVFAAILAGTHHGISENLSPTMPFGGDASTLNDPTLPRTIDAALVTFENCSILREYFQGGYVDRYCSTKRTELERFRNFIPAHEYEWYL
ncbi:MAG: hypothetical protein SGJ03_09260 [Alphaproteobacteria bacterium]|nr:hypothetical protein [Alphaproteobacteria bacterium]